MRSLAKLDEPEVLKNNHGNWLQEYNKEPQNSTKRYRYRHPEIKTTLKQETGNKCIYCESKIGHNTPGDIEHKVPSSKQRDLHFVWSNLTIACTECNRRKNNYYEVENEFLDPYSEIVEEVLEHHGPLVLWKNKNNRAEITVKTLKLNDHSRSELIIRKITSIDDFNNLLERYLSETNTPLKELLWRQILKKISKSSEYSGMLISVMKVKGMMDDEKLKLC